MYEKDDVLRDLELLRLELKNKTEPDYEGPAGLITIEHDDYHAQYIGRTKEGMQFFVTGLFVPKTDDNSRREFIAVFLFNDAGDLVESRVDELDSHAPGYEDALNLEALRVTELGTVEFQGIKVKPFAAEHYGIMMGLIPNKHEDEWWVELMPGNFMAFHEPWDEGEYDT